MQDWRFFNFEGEYTEARMKYTDEASTTHTYANLPLFHCPDLVIQPEDIATRTRIFEEVWLFSILYFLSYDCKRTVIMLIYHYSC